MKPSLLSALKFIALQGGTRHSVHISSTALAEMLDISQQSASRKLIELENSNYIDRKLAQGGQIVGIKSSGITALKKEFTEYQLIFGNLDKVKINGILEKGLGEGGYYISKEGYMKQFKKILSWAPYKGTFNIRLDESQVPKVEAIKAAEGILIEGFEQEGRSFGKAWIFKCTLKGNGNLIEKAAIIAPKRTHYKNVVELISPHFIREKLNANDGDSFEVDVEL